MLSGTKMATSNDDCFYFYTSTCTKGNNCAYRHCEAARQSTVTCAYWKQNKCNSTECPYRHSEMIKPIMQNKAELPCYFESVASGCTRPMCPFKHLIPRPPKATKTSSSSTNIITLVDATQDDVMCQPTPGSLAEPDYSVQSSLVAPVIDPIIVNPGEDSDFDSPYNSPVKSVVHKSASMSNIIDVTSRKDLTFQEPGKKNEMPAADPVRKALSQPSGKTSPLLKPTPPKAKALALKRKVISSSPTGKTVSQVKKISPTTKSSKKVRQLSSTSPRTKLPDKKAVTAQQNRARKAVATAKDRSKHGGQVVLARTPEDAKQHTVKKEVAPVSVEPKIISLKKKGQEIKEEVKTTDEENSDEDLGIKSLEQTLRERALRSMGIIELKSGRVVRTKDQPVKKEEPVKRRKRSSDGEKSKSDRSERNSSETLPVHKRIGTVKRTQTGRKRSIEERNSLARNMEREERIKRLQLEQERENKRRQIMAAKRKARARKVVEAVVVKKEEAKEESANEEETSSSQEEEEEGSEESTSEGGNADEMKDEEEILGEEVDIELGDEEEKEEVPVKLVYDTRRAIRKSEVVQEVTIKKTFVVEEEKPKRKRRVILEDEEPAPKPIFSIRSNIISKPKEVKKKAEEVKKPKLDRTQEEKRSEPVVQLVVKPMVSAPKVKATNVWSRRAWDSKPKESGDSADSHPSLGGIRNRLGIPRVPTGGSAGDQEAEPKIKRRLGWRKTAVVSAEDDTDSDSTTAVKKAVSLAAIRARVGQRPPTGNDEHLTTIQSESREDMSAATKRYRQPIQIYVPPGKKRCHRDDVSSDLPASVPDDEEPSKKRLVESDMEVFKDKIKPKEAKTFVQIMAEKRERQKKLVEEQKKNSESLDGSPGKKMYPLVKFGIDERDLADDSAKSRLPGESPLSMSMTDSVLPSRSSSLSSSSTSGHLPVSTTYSESTATSSISQITNVTPISTESLHGTPAISDNLGDDLDNRFTEKEDTVVQPPISTYKTAPTIAVSEVSSTQDLAEAEDSSTGLSQNRDQICVAALSLPSDKMESITTITSDVRQEEENVSPAKRSSHNDSWLDIDIGDLDEDIAEDETNDDDLLREIDELLA